MPTVATGADRRVLRDARHARHAALGKERVNQCLGLLGRHAFQGDLALAHAALGEGQRDGGLERVNRP